MAILVGIGFVLDNSASEGILNFFGLVVIPTALPEIIVVWVVLDAVAVSVLVAVLVAAAAPKGHCPIDTAVV